ncbi:F-actin-capping protein subunit alpha [Pelagophyceae sp. CCMP2097]|nr:F-actin-capping protein subunit alpha [Pelagophyceae sp. CCMP2097]
MADSETVGDEELEDEVVSDAEKLQIVQHFLLNAPPGEFDEVLLDSASLVPEGLVSQPMLAGISRAYNVAGLRVCETEGKAVILCKAGEVDSTHYLEPDSKVVYSVDHVSGTATKSDVEAPATAFEAERAAIAEAVDAYVKARFGSSKQCAAVYAPANGALQVVISAEQVNLRNFWSGNWRSTWTVAVDGASCTVDGAVAVRAHYFEDGNVQLQTQKASPPLTFAYADASELAAEVVATIERAETALQAGLEDMYSNMTNETFKAMRRVMPVTRTKMKWNLHELALNRNLRK